LKVSSVGVGTWAWGDTLYWQYKDEDEKDAAEAFAASMDAGINLFDTAEIYGSGQSEILCGKFARNYVGTGDREIQVATKLMPLPNRFLNSRAAVGEALRDSLSRLGTDSCDPQPSTLNPQPSTLNPQPLTLNPQPWSLNPKP
jgi:aryl-alcohol dehydrogenase-like predicted oxidoreductase